MHGCMDAWMHGCMDAWMHGCMDAHVCTYAHPFSGRAKSNLIHSQRNFEGKHVRFYYLWIFGLSHQKNKTEVLYPIVTTVTNRPFASPTVTAYWTAWPPGLTHPWFPEQLPSRSWTSSSSSCVKAGNTRRVFSNSSLVVFHQPSWKICASQIGSWNPKVRGENKKIFELPPPRSTWEGYLTSFNQCINLIGGPIQYGSNDPLPNSTCSGGTMGKTNSTDWIPRMSLKIRSSKSCFFGGLGNP